MLHCTLPFLQSIFGLGLCLQHTFLQHHSFPTDACCSPSACPSLRIPRCLLAVALECALISNTRNNTRASEERGAIAAKPASISRFTFVVRCFKSASGRVEDRRQSSQSDGGAVRGCRVCRQSGFVLLALTSGHQAAAAACPLAAAARACPTARLPLQPPAAPTAATAQSIMTFKWEPRCNLCASRHQAVGQAGSGPGGRFLESRARFRVFFSFRFLSLFCLFSFGIV